MTSKTYTPSLGLDYAVYERTKATAYGWGSWELISVFLNERDAERFCREDECAIAERKVFVTGECWERWHTQEHNASHEGVRKLFKGCIEKYKDAHITGALSRYQLPDL
jgi:hypothetical protein